MIRTRQDLAKHFNKLGFKTGAEIGVLKGHYSDTLCREIPGLKLYCIDSWGIEKGRLQDYHIRAYKRAREKLRRYNATLIRKLSMDAVHDFEDESLDFVYIDANHFVDAVTDDINEWSKKVKIGGIISGHDYRPKFEKTRMGPTEAVNAFIKSHSLDLHLTTDEPETLSWWFVKDRNFVQTKEPLVSIIVPADKDPFIQRTIDSLLENAQTEIEIIVVLDNYAPDPPLKSNPRVRVINSPGHGMRAAINAGLARARGKFIMKCDCHCAFGPGYDKILAENCKENWIVNPLHYNIDHISWKRIMSPVFVYNYIGYPLVTSRHGTMLPGRNWPERERTRSDPKYDVDDTMFAIGGCWLANRKYFLKTVGVLNDYPDAYGPMFEEDKEISLKYWLGGGEAKIVKKTWFAHFAKRPHMAHIYQSKWDDKLGASSRTWNCRHWMNNEEPGMIHPFSWLVEKFWPVPTWPENRSMWVFPESGTEVIPNLEHPLTELCKIGIKYNSVKCPRLGHCYTPFYFELFKERRDKIKKVLEIGDPGYSGSDLRMWRDFFPHAQIFGASINPQSIFPKDRVTTYKFDETNEIDIKKLILTIGSDIDLVIDNANNHSYHQMFLLQNLMPLLNPGVTYVVENCSRTRQLSRAFPQYNSQVPGLLANENNIRDGLIVFTHKNS